MRTQGFTLAELLIALTVLGLIATFTIPKLLYLQKQAQWNAQAKEAVASIADAFTAYKAAGNVPSASTTPDMLKTFFNQVNDANGVIVDNRPFHASASSTCGASTGNCLRLHNGGILLFRNQSFGGTTNLNTVGFSYDPDGIFTGNKDSITFHLYYNGRITSRANTLTNSVSSNNAPPTLDPDSTFDPDWFKW